jgi:signal transduction histidine kinase
MAMKRIRFAPAGMISPRLLTLAVTALHIVATLLVLYELDLQHYQVGKKQLIADNFDEYLSLPTEEIKDLASTVIHHPIPAERLRALTALDQTLSGLVASQQTPAFRFVLRDADGSVLLDRADFRKPRRQEDWSNSLFLRGFQGSIDMRLPPNRPRLVGERLPVGRLQAFYGSPVGRQAVAELTAHHRRLAGGLLLISLLIYGLVYRYLLRPMEVVSRGLEGARVGPPLLLVNPVSLLEFGYNRMAGQAILQQLDEILDPLLSPSLSSQAIRPVLHRAMDWCALQLGTGRIILAQATPPDQDLEWLEVMTWPLDQEPSEAEWELLKATRNGEGAPDCGPDGLALGGARLQGPGRCLVAWIAPPRGEFHADTIHPLLGEAARTFLRPLAAALTMHQELFRQSREANIVLSRNLGHDLTNIIATAKLDLASMKHLLQQDVTAMPERKKEALQGSVRALLDTTRLLQEVVNIYRAFSFLKRPIREAVDLKVLLEGLVETLRPTVSRRLELILELPEENVEAMVEARLLKLALFNLVQNSMDAFKRQTAEHQGGDRADWSPRLTLRLAWREGDPRPIVLEVEDNGPGIRDREGRLLSGGALASIFGFGYSTKDREVNEGLGLAWVRTIIEEFHGGLIQASNRGEGGACFRMELPVGPPESSSVTG